MTEDITSLQIRILYDSIDKAESRLKKLEETGGKAASGMKNQEKAADGLMKKMLGLAAAYLSVRTVANQFRQIIQTTREWQIINSSIETVTGSAENAKEAWQALLDLAWELPFGIEKVSETFINLINFGLTPSERAIRSYANTAASMGRDITEFAGAVAKATTGEFESLKGFGILAAKEGDKVRFRFKGAVTEVENTTRAIEEYFMTLGEEHFGGAVERRLELLDDAFEGLGESWKRLQFALGESFFADSLNTNLRKVTDVIWELTEMVSSGQLEAGLESWSIAFEGFAEGWLFAFGEIKQGLFEVDEQAGETGYSVMEQLVGGGKAVLIYYQGFVKSMGVIWFAIVDSAMQAVMLIVDAWVIGFRTMIANAKVAGRAIADGLNPFSGKGFGASLESGFNQAIANTKKGFDEVGKSWDQRMAKIGINAQVAAGDVATYYNEAGEQLDRSIGKEQEAAVKRAQWDKDAEARAAAREDRLKKYGSESDESLRTPKPKASGGGRGSGGGGASDNEWKTLEESLRNQETLISESYARRLDLIKQNTRDGSAYQAELQLSLTEKFEEEQERRIAKMKAEPETMFEAYAEQERIIEESYEKRKEIILSATELTESEKLRMLEEAELQYTSSMRKHETERNKVALGLAADFFGNISAIAGAFGKKGAKIAKAAAIAETTVKTYQAATSAYAALAGIPYVGPALGAAAAGAAIAAGLANIQKIKSTDDSGGYSGAYAIGGLIPPGKVGLVGEAGPELVKGPAMVTSAQATWDRAGGAAQRGGGQVEVNIINMSGEPVTEKRRQDGDKQMIEFIIGQAAEKVANDISKGGTRVAKAIEGTYNMGRGKRA